MHHQCITRLDQDREDFNLAFLLHLAQPLPCTAHLTGQQSCKIVDETLKPSVFSLKTQDQNHKSKETNATVEVLLNMISFSKVLKVTIHIDKQFERKNPLTP